ncbi:hypothetical protein HDU67_002448 [Dinochytrium kinnereticum]|nr:hypothetical protein HDU67_002448 [Dinochytrium kinnereticum]
MATGAPTPEPTPWFDLALAGPDIPRDAINRLIYEHLLHNCYSDTAAAFATACQLNGIGKSGPPAGLVVMDLDEGRYSPVKDEDVDMMDADDADKPSKGPSTPNTHLPPLPTSSTWSTALATLEPRKRLRSLLCEGKIGEAIQFCKMSFPKVLAGNTPGSLDVCFQLQCQQFIENVRVSAPEAVKFAQMELGQFGNLGQKYIEVLQDIVALIAYKDPFKSPVARYLSQERRDEVASNVTNSFAFTLLSPNLMIICCGKAAENLPPHTKIESLVAQLITVTDTLHEQSFAEKKTLGGKLFPKWDLEGFVGAEA